AKGLLQLDGAAGFLDLLLDLFGLGLVHAFLERLRRALDESLGFGQAQAGDGADFLDDLDLLATVAGEDDVEFVLFLGSSGFTATTGGRAGNGHGGRGADAPFFLERLGKLGGFHDGQLRQFFNKLGDIGHDLYSVQLMDRGFAPPGEFAFGKTAYAASLAP